MADINRFLPQYARTSGVQEMTTSELTDFSDMHTNDMFAPLKRRVEGTGHTIERGKRAGTVVYKHEYDVPIAGPNNTTVIVNKDLYRKFVRYFQLQGSHDKLLPGEKRQLTPIQMEIKSHPKKYLEQHLRDVLKTDLPPRKHHHKGEQDTVLSAMALFFEGAAKAARTHVKNKHTKGQEHTHSHPTSGKGPNHPPMPHQGPNHPPMPRYHNDRPERL